MYMTVGACMHVHVCMCKQICKHLHCTEQDSQNCQWAFGKHQNQLSVLNHPPLQGTARRELSTLTPSKYGECNLMCMQSSRPKTVLTGMTMQDETYRSVSSFCAASTLQSNRSELVDSSHFESHFESGDSGESLHLNARDTLSCSKHVSSCTRLSVGWHYNYSAGYSRIAIPIVL